MYQQMIAVTNRHLCRPDAKAPAGGSFNLTAFLEQIDRIASLGVRAIVLREKDLSSAEYEALARKVLPICAAHQTELILHGFSDSAIRLDHKKIHLSLALLRKLKTDETILKNSAHKTDIFSFEKIGASVHSLAEALEAQSLGAHYLFAGNIYETACKQGLPGRGLTFLQQLCARCDIPVYAIGGVTPERMPEILQTGAAGGCMMSGFMQLYL